MAARSHFRTHLAGLALAVLVTTSVAHADIPLSTTPGWDEAVRAVTFSPHGGFLLLVWQHIANTSGDGELQWKLFSGESALNDVLPAQGATLPTGPGRSTNPQLTRVGSIGCPGSGLCTSVVVAYWDWLPPANPELRAQRFGDGMSWDLPVTESDSLISGWRITGDSGTGALICWAESSGDSLVPRAQRLAGDGTRMWGSTGLAVADPVRATTDIPRIASDGLGGAFIVW